MPYERLGDLPESVRDNVPRHAQEIYLEAFNSAWDQYADPDELPDDASREETAHRVARAAAKQSHETGAEDRGDPKGGGPGGRAPRRGLPRHAGLPPHRPLPPLAAALRLVACAGSWPATPEAADALATFVIVRDGEKLASPD